MNLLCKKKVGTFFLNSNKPGSEQNFYRVTSKFDSYPGLKKMHFMKDEIAICQCCGLSYQITDLFNQCLECAAPKCRLKYTTIHLVKHYV